MDSWANFRTTRWSLVGRAGERVRPALEELLGRYWAPVRTLFRQLGCAPDLAEDLTQTLFTELVERGDLAGLSAEQGRFRSWLRACCRHRYLKHLEREGRQRRGGGRARVALDKVELVGGETPERAFDRAWAQAALAAAADALRQEMVAAGKREQFEVLWPYVDGSESRYQAAAERLGATSGALRVAVHRLRKRFGHLLRCEVAQTVTDPAMVDQELAAIREALAR